MLTVELNIQVNLAVNVTKYFPAILNLLPIGFSEENVVLLE